MNKVALFLYISGFVFLGLALKSYLWPSSIPDEQKHFLAMNEDFEIHRLVDADGFGMLEASYREKQDPILALFLMPAESCSTCINEVHSFVSLFEEEGFVGNAVEYIAVVTDTDIQRAARFANISDLQLPTLYGYNPHFVSKLQSFGTDTVQQQMLLIDKKSQKIFFKVRLVQGRVSSPKAKQEILVAARRAYEVIAPSS